MQQGLTFALIAGVVGAALGAPPVCVDGVFDEWEDVAVVARDPAGDSRGVFDVTSVSVMNRGARLYLRFDTGSTLNLQAGPGDDIGLTIEIGVIDGARLAIDCRERVFRMAEPGASRERYLGWEDFDYTALPTYAAREFEACVDLAPLGAVPGDTVTIDFAGSDRLARPARYTLVGPEPSGADAASIRSSARRRATDVRVASLNTRRNGLADADRRDALTRLIAGAAPDVVAIQEEYTTGAAEAMAVLSRATSATWHVHKHNDCLVASRRPLVAAASHDPSYAAAIVELERGASLLVLSIHPKCCGYTGSKEDDRRVAQTRAMTRTIAEVRAARPGVGVVVLGDWNLVGSRRPLDLLTAPDGPALTHRPLRHLAAASVVTWRDEESDFAPGLLDLVVYDAARLSPRNGYVLDTHELDRATLDAMGLRADDSAATDHLLLVVDFAPVGAAAPPAREKERR